MLQYPRAMRACSVLASGQFGSTGPRLPTSPTPLLQCGPLRSGKVCYTVWGLGLGCSRLSRATPRSSSLGPRALRAAPQPHRSSFGAPPAPRRPRVRARQGSRISRHTLCLLTFPPLSLLLSAHGAALGAPAHNLRLPSPSVHPPRQQPRFLLSLSLALLIAPAACFGAHTHAR